jgi:hypothetical protein
MDKVEGMEVALCLKKFISNKQHGEGYCRLFVVLA